MIINRFQFTDMQFGMMQYFRHVFMGLTICGQFMLSYKIISDEDSALNNYSFTSTYKYE